MIKKHITEKTAYLEEKYNLSTFITRKKISKKQFLDYIKKEFGEQINSKFTASDVKKLVLKKTKKIRGNLVNLTFYKFLLKINN